METDIPLKTLTEACAPDLLPLFGVPDAEVLSVESLELPSGASRLDNVLRLRSLQGGDYRLLVEWQGYKDPRFLWRVLGYLAWLGQHGDDQPIAVTLVYLHPSDDVGQTLRQVIAGREDWTITFRCVRLWEQDAAAAVQSGRLGLAVLSPLMLGATARLVEEAASLVLEQATPPHRQADLLSVLGVFAEPLMDPTRFAHMVGEERLMASDLVGYLVERRYAAERAADAAERAAQEKQRAEEQAERVAMEQALVQMVEDALIARFPAAPVALVAAIRAVRNPPRLQELHRAILQAPDQASVEALLRAAASDPSS